MSNLAESKICVGCSACANICSKGCIEMKKDSAGFSYPVIMCPTNCIECGLCESVCPVSNQNINTKDDLSSAYAAFSKDESIRLDSSSGGIFTEVAKRIISQNGVVYGAAYSELFEVHHCCVDSVEDLNILRGAKYSESDLGDTFRAVLSRLEKGQQVLFSGTPCQVAGLKAFIGEDFDNLICIDFVCHGVPSPAAWKAYIEFRAREDADGEFPHAINLRSKETGWSQYQYSTVFEYGNGKKYCVSSSDSLYMKLFIGDYISRESCEDCRFKGYSRCSDITLGDFWGIWDIDPEMDDNKGTSVILVHSEKGQAIWKEISSSIRYKDVTCEQASQQNPSMLASSKANINRELVLKKIQEGNIGTCEEFFPVIKSQKVSLVSRVKRRIKRLITE